MFQRDFVALGENQTLHKALKINKNCNCSISSDVHSTEQLHYDSKRIKLTQRDLVALGENQTRNFVARHKLGFHTTSSLCLGIILATSLLGIS